LPPIVVPTPTPVVPPGCQSAIVDPAPSINPFAPLLPPPAGPPLAETPPLLVDFWAIGQHHVGSTPSNLAMSELSIAYDFRYPIGPVTLGARPLFEVMFLSGPTPPGPDLPPQVYALAVALEGEFRIDQRFSIRASITPGIYTDFHNVSIHAFRLPAELVAAYALTPEVVLVGGVMYTAQPSLSVLPVAGVVWTPEPQWRLELLFPRTRVIHHFLDGLNVYGTIGLYGETFAVHDPILGNDLYQYRDVRLGFGAEWDTRVRLHLFFEAGLSFWRRLEVEGVGTSVDPGVYLRVGGRF
jgi:hypothetical protein